MMIHDLLMSESAKYEPSSQKELETSILQCIPKTAGTAVIFESTAKGIGGEFYKGFWASRIRYEMYLDENYVPKWRKSINVDADPDNEYCHVFIPAFAFLEYRAPVPEDFKLTEDEVKLKKTFNLPDEYLVWRRLTLANECKGDINVYHQEYPHTAREAFISSGSPAFDVEKVLAAKEIALKFPPIARYNCLLTSGQWVVNNADGELLVWEEPRVNVPYLISADVAEGLVHGDFSSVSVWNHFTGMQCAHFHSKKIDPYDLATFLNHLGRRYNTALIVPERNNHGRGVVDRLLRDFMYPHVYVDTIEDPPHKPRKRFGWITTVKTRPEILDNLKIQISTTTHGIRCPEVFDEMLNFKRQDDGKEEADEGTFDDRVMDVAIGKWCVLNKQPVKVPKPTQTTTSTQAQTSRQMGVVRARNGQKPPSSAFS
jgi:hypothetical protein